MVFIGWIGSIMLSICGLPQAWESFRTKNSNGISWGFILLWLFGEIFALLYVVHKQEYPIIFNCILNTLIVSVIFYYKWKNFYFRRYLLKIIIKLERFYIYEFN